MKTGKIRMQRRETMRGYDEERGLEIEKEEKDGRDREKNTAG